MRGAIVTEGKDDVSLLRGLLGGLETTHVEFFAAGGLSAVDSLARSLLARGRTDIAVAVDSDSRDPNVGADRKRFLSQSLREIAPEASSTVILFQPEIESVFFKERPILDRLLSAPIGDTDFVEGFYEPKKILAKHLGKRSLAGAVAQLPPQDLEKLRDQPEMRDLIAFLSKDRLTVPR